MIIYIITNRWYRLDNLFKVGVHRQNTISSLVKQYIGRYMPEVDIVAHYKVEDGFSMESVIHRRLSEHGSITRVRAEWFQGEEDDIIDVVEGTISSCSNDPYTIKEGGRTYHLSCESNERLIRIGRDAGIVNPFPPSTDRWRHMQLFLLTNKNRIIEEYEATGDTKVRSGLIPRSMQPDILYAYVGTDIDRMLDGLGIIPFKGITKRDIIYIAHNGTYKKRMLDSMTIPQLKELAGEMGISIPSKMRKADIVKAILK